MKGISKKKKISNGNSPIHFALRTKNRDIVQVLLNDEQLNLNAVNAIGEFPLMMAIKMNDFALFQSLLKFNVDLNQADKEGNSCLLHAINNDLNEVALFLISNKKVDINKSNKLKGTTPLMAAAKKNSIVICSAIYNRENIDIYAKDDEGISFYIFGFIIQHSWWQLCSIHLRLLSH